MQPRVIRLKNAAIYLGMDKNRFNEEVRPSVTEFPIGTQGIGFDRVDLDAWFDDYKRRNGRPGVRSKQWDAKNQRGSIYEVESGILTKSSTKSAFAKALAQVTSTKRTGI